jgi:hypothetical protein
MSCCDLRCCRAHRARLPIAPNRLAEFIVASLRPRFLLRVNAAESFWRVNARSNMKTKCANADALRATSGRVRSAKPTPQMARGAFAAYAALRPFWSAAALPPLFRSRPLHPRSPARSATAKHDAVWLVFAGGPSFAVFAKGGAFLQSDRRRSHRPTLPKPGRMGHPQSRRRLSFVFALRVGSFGRCGCNLKSGGRAAALQNVLRQRKRTVGREASLWAARLRPWRNDCQARVLCLALDDED